MLEQALPLSGRVLDIGTGKGRFVVPLARQAMNITTVDVNGEEQRRARLEAMLADFSPSGFRVMDESYGGRVGHLLPSGGSELGRRWRQRVHGRIVVGEAPTTAREARALPGSNATGPR